MADDGRIVAWSVMRAGRSPSRPLDWDEKVVAAELLARLPPPAGPDELVLADSNYDSAPLSALCAAAGRPLLSPLRAQQRVKPGPDGRPAHHPATLRTMGPARRATVAAWHDHPALCRYVLKSRIGIERNFSTLTCAGGGLGPLPAWVRSLARVRRWVGAKIALYHARLELRAEHGTKAVARRLHAQSCETVPSEGEGSWPVRWVKEPIGGSISGAGRRRARAAGRVGNWLNWGPRRDAPDPGSPPYGATSSTSFA